jgi:hypothetical protein
VEKKRTAALSRSPSCIDSIVDTRDFFDPAMPLFVRHRHDGLSVPMEVIGDERYLLENILKRVAYYSPRRPNSFSNL